MLARRKSPILVLIGLYAMVNDMGGCCCARAILGASVVRGKVSLAVAVFVMAAHLMFHSHSEQPEPLPVPSIEAGAEAVVPLTSAGARIHLSRPSPAVHTARDGAAPVRTPAGPRVRNDTESLRALPEAYRIRGSLEPSMTVTNRSAGRPSRTCSV